MFQILYSFPNNHYATTVSFFWQYYYNYESMMLNLTLFFFSFFYLFFGSTFSHFLYIFSQTFWESNIGDAVRFGGVHLIF